MSQNLKEWNDLSLLKAINEKQIYVIPDESSFIPGPRIFLLAKSYAEIYKHYLNTVH